LLSEQYLKLVVIAFVIATPIAWWGAHKWLQNFAYTIELHWWFFVLSGVAGVTVAFLTVGFHALKAATANPVKSLRTD
jgi:putative ABC transport system permease protein